MGAIDPDPGRSTTVVIDQPECGVPLGLVKALLRCRPSGNVHGKHVSPSQALDLPFLLWIPHYFISIAVTARMATFAGLLGSMRNLTNAKKGIAS